MSGARRRDPSGRADRDRVLGRAGEVAAVALPGTQVRVESPSNEARHRVFLVGLACLVFAWFNTGSCGTSRRGRSYRSRSTASPPVRPARSTSPW